MEDHGMISGFYVKTGSHVRGGGGNNNNMNNTNSKCGRWNPTSEQVKVLTDLFRSGLRTPSTDQIQKISTQLSFYGKIESKNVFYWFQNHKARERQKRRKVSSSSSTTTPTTASLRHQDMRIKDNNIFTRQEEKIIPPPNHHFLDINEVRESSSDQRLGVETLQLFPLNSIHDDQTDHNMMRFHASNYYRDASARALTYTIEKEVDHSPLDLRLSFI